MVLGLDGSGANGTQDPRQDQRVKETWKGYIYDTHDDDNMKERGGRGGVRWEEEVDSLYQYTACWLHPEHPGRIYCQALGHAADVGQGGGGREGGCIERRDTGCCTFLVTGSVASLDHRVRVGVLGDCRTTTMQMQMHRRTGRK